MPDFIGLESWDDSDPERADRERDAYDDALLAADPPPEHCGSCGDQPQGCCVCRQGRPLTDDYADDLGFGRPR